MFYARYVDLCDKNKVSPSRVAIDCNFNKGSVSVWKKKYEAGEDVKPSSDILLKLSDYFGVSVDYLLGQYPSKRNRVSVDLYEILKGLCDKKGVSGAKMCEDIGYSKSLMTELKSGRKKTITLDTACRIANYFEVPVEYLSTESTENPITITDDEVSIDYLITGQDKPSLISIDGDREELWDKYSVLDDEDRATVKDLVASLLNKEKYK